MTEKRTKQDRLIALADAYRAMFCNTKWTTREVADWAISHRLFPVPGMRDALELHTRWNERFAELTLNMKCDPSASLPSLIADR